MVVFAVRLRAGALRVAVFLPAAFLAVVLPAAFFVAVVRPLDQVLLRDEGLPFRPWYRHMIYAPGRFTGYGAKTLPGVREAIEERRFDDATKYIGLTAAALSDYAAGLDAATAIVNGG